MTDLQVGIGLDCVLYSLDFGLCTVYETCCVSLPKISAFQSIPNYSTPFWKFILFYRLT